MPTFDWSISLGNLVMAVIALGGVVAAIVKTYQRLDRCLHKQAHESKLLAERMHAENKERIAVIESKFDLLEWYLKDRDRRA